MCFQKETFAPHLVQKFAIRELRLRTITSHPAALCSFGTSAMATKDDSAKEATRPLMGIHSAVGKAPTMAGTEFVVQLVAMSGSMYLWVGAGDQREQQMNNLTAALTSRSTTLVTPSVATIFEGISDDSSLFAEGMAQRICQRTNQVVFVSYNLPITASPDEALLLEVEKVCSQLIKSL